MTNYQELQSCVSCSENSSKEARIIVLGKPAACPPIRNAISSQRLHKNILFASQVSRYKNRGTGTCCTSQKYILSSLQLGFS